MKAPALAGRDKPKDTYDICYCLERFPGGLAKLAAEWKRRRGEKDVTKAVEIMTAKFTSVDAFGPHQLVDCRRCP
jgi:hypothetical protein